MSKIIIMTASNPEVNKQNKFRILGKHPVKITGKTGYLAGVFLSFFLFLLVFPCLTFQMGSNERLLSVSFEVFGRVQGVFFRKYTETEAKKLGLRGWCMNTQQGTVQGVIEGTPPKINQMKTWLQKTGSPQSRIDQAVFTNEKDISQYSFDSFSIKR